jgi:hypothetical protein
MSRFVGNNTKQEYYFQDDFQEWVLDQDDYWVNAYGDRHVLEEMPKDYLLNVLIFLHERYPFEYQILDKSPLVKRLRELILG